MGQVKCDVCGNVVQYEEMREQSCTEQETADVHGMLTEILLNTREQCVMVDDMIRNQINLKDEQIDKPHAELQYFKDDEASKFINQVRSHAIEEVCYRLNQEAEGL